MAEGDGPGRAEERADYARSEHFLRLIFIIIQFYKSNEDDEH